MSVAGGWHFLRIERGRENNKEERVFGLSGVGIKPKIKKNNNEERVFSLSGVGIKPKIKRKIEYWENAERLGFKKVLLLLLLF